MNGLWHTTPVESGVILRPPELLAQEDTTPLDPGVAVDRVTRFFDGLVEQLGEFLPSLLGAIAILLVGWIVASVVASIVKGLLKRTDLDNRLARAITGRSQEESMPQVEEWTAKVVYWTIMIFVLIAFLQTLQLEVVSEPLNDFLNQIFVYLPKLGGAAVLLAVAWVLATICKMVVTRGLEQFRLDDRLAEQTGQSREEGGFLLNETLGNALYWFIFLFFLPLILDALELNVEPVENLLDDVLSALPRILMALIIGAVGWLIARIVRGIVTNLLAATGTDRLGAQFGLAPSESGMSLSQLLGTVVYVLILVPTAIAALNSLEIDAISEPAIAMLTQILNAIPLIFTAAFILVVFYVIGKFVADLVTRILTSVGFNNVFAWLGLPTTQTGTPPEPPPAESPSTPPTAVQQPGGKTPSEIAGIVTLVGIVLFGAVAATEVLQFQALTIIVSGIIRIAGLVLVGLLVFGIGLYLANFAYNLIASSRGSQAEILGQAARIAIIAFAAAMALQQMGIAPHIVNLAFGLLFGAIAVAIALAFGLGGRDVANEQLREWLNDFKQRRQK